MSLLDPSTTFTDAEPNQNKKWDDLSCTQVWTMFIDGKSFAQITKAVGKNEKAIRRQIENQIDHFERHPNTKYVGELRSDREWTQRDTWVLERFLKKRSAELYTIADMLGRSIDSVTIKASRKGLIT